MTMFGRIPLLAWIAVAVGSSACGGANDPNGNPDNGTSGSSGGEAGSTGGGGIAGAAVTGGAAGGGASPAGGTASGNGGAAGSRATPRDGGVAEAGANPVTRDAAVARGDAASLPCDLKWPVPSSSQDVPTTITVSGTYDGAMKRFVGTGALGTATQSETQGPLFDLADGAVLKNVVLGSPAADGVHCEGNCTLQNVWWEDVGEDAATLKGRSASQVMTIDGGGALHASDKIFQHNGPGTMIIKNFYAKDFGKLYRSCGNCGTQYTRHALFQNVTLVVPGASVAGVNTNYMDTATFQQITICDAARKMTVCTRYTGNDTGAEPPSTGKGADGTSCIYAPSDITWLSP